MMLFHQQFTIGSSTQATYIARRKAWYNAVGSAYLQFLQGRRPDSPVVHNFRVVSVQDKLMTRKSCDSARTTSVESSEGKCPSNKKFLTFSASGTVLQ